MPTGEKKKRFIAMIALMLAVICLSTQFVEASAVLSWGSRGEQVSAMQRKLRQWGYYNGTIDGIFGRMTYDAVV
ncbi:MAG: peptidoglycan-binding protein, partial [Clostridia bacterium]|nr:peptidoglycan-binding protein [Clostridia bacterium]